MKIYRCRRYLGDQLITEIYLYSDSEVDMAWLRQFKDDVVRNSHPFDKLEVMVFEQVGDVETIVPDNPLPLVD